MDYDNLRQIGSETARHGFQNERDVIQHFRQYETNVTVQSWLRLLGHHYRDIETINVGTVTGHFKSDIYVKVNKVSNTSTCHYIQVKLVSNLQGYNQIDKRWVDRYCELWNIPNDIRRLLKLYTGEIEPIRIGRDSRRMFADEFCLKDQNNLKEFFFEKKHQILNTIL